MSPAFLPSGHGFEPHLLHCFLTFYVDLIKWIDELTSWPDTVSRPTWRVCAIVVARVHLAHVGHRYADLIKWFDGLTGWPDTVSRPAWRACDIGVAHVYLARIGRRLTSIDVQQINLKYLWGVIYKKMTHDDRWNWCFKYSIDYISILLIFLWNQC
jgi:hypothetical protein